MDTSPDDARAVQRVPARLANIGGGIPVARLLPSAARRMVGAWCFLDHAGPATFAPGAGMRVGAHPHIGLQTFTWMVEGEVLHRDSLGNVQTIRPGEVNLMTAGRGLSHTEESAPGETRLHAAQLWIALPSSSADCEPAFDHLPVLPRWSAHGCDFTLLAGAMAGREAPAKLHSPLVGVDLSSASGATLALDLRADFEYGVLPLQGAATIGGERWDADELAFLGAGATTLALRLEPGARVLLIGGAPFGEEIVLWWNFVGRDRAEVGRALRDWQAGAARFGRVAGHDGPPLVAPALPWAEAEPLS